MTTFNINERAASKIARLVNRLPVQRPLHPFAFQNWNRVTLLLHAKQLGFVWSATPSRQELVAMLLKYYNAR